jgi:MFS family permease
VWPSAIGIGAAAGICGLGIGIGSVAATVLGTAVSDTIKATAAGVLNTAAQLGTAIGTALVLLIATTLQPRTAWIVVVVLAATAGAVAAARAPRRHQLAPLPGVSGA